MAQTVSINMVPHAVLPQIVTASQNDEGREVIISLLDESAPYTLQATDTVTLEMKKPDNNIVTAALTPTADSNAVTLVLTEQMCAVPGRSIAEIRVIRDGTDIGSANFVLDVEASPITGGGHSESVIYNIEAIVTSVADQYVSALLADIAPTYSDSALYSVGQYAWYDGDLYRCTTPITTAEAWTAAHWTAAVLGDDVGDLKSVLNYKTETLFNSFPYESAKETPWAVTESSSYQQLIFDNKHQQVVKPYIVRLTTDTVISFTRIEFRNTSNVAVANVSVNGKATPTGPFYFAINPTGTSKINRIRFYGASNSANINLDFFDFVAITKANVSAVMGLDYIANFAVNKTATLTWIADKYVDANNPNYLRDNGTYSVTNFDVKKGDIIKVYYPNADHMLDSSKGVLAERIVYGSGEFEYGFRVIYTGGGTKQEYIYVAEKDMSVTVCGQNDQASYYPQIYVYSVPAYAISKEFASERYNQFKYNLVTDKLQIGKASRNGYGGTTYPKPLTLLHYSDVHNDFLNVSNVKTFLEKYRSINIDDAICTGDMTGNKFPAYYPIYGLEDYKNILLCIGNHDVYDVNNDAESHGVSYDNEGYWATNLQKYNQYFAPSIANWNVIQPTDAATLGLCYYYKDYSSNGYGYRLIVLDAMAFDNDQYAWLVSALADAKTNNRTVVIADHFAPITGLGDINGFATPFMSLLTGMEYNYAVSRLTTTAGSAMDAVDAFINGGGDFACWLCGHMHYDMAGKLASHPNQIFIAVASANVSAVWLDMPRTKNTISEDCFNIVSIDPRLKVIKVERIGATIDDWGRIHDHMSIDYAARTLIATS